MKKATKTKKRQTSSKKPTAKASTSVVVPEIHNAKLEKRRTARRGIINAVTVGKLPLIQTQSNIDQDNPKFLKKQNEPIGGLQLLFGCMFSGKCLHPTQRVLLADGQTKPAGELVFGDTLLAPDHTPTTICAISTIESRGFVIQDKDSHTEYSVNDDHILVLQDSKQQLLQITAALAFDRQNSESLYSVYSHSSKCDPKTNTVVPSFSSSTAPVKIVRQSEETTTYISFTLLETPLFLLPGNVVTHNSSELLKRLIMWSIMGRRVLAIKHANDLRYESKAKTSKGKGKRSKQEEKPYYERKIITHQNSSLEALAIEFISDLNDDILSQIDVLGVDEGQFFYGFAEDILNIRRRFTHILIIVAALNGDSQRNLFGSVCYLIPEVTRMDHFQGICHLCGSTTAAFNYRLESADNSSQTLVGGADLYKSACNECYERELHKQQREKSSSSSVAKTRANSKANKKNKN